MREVETDYGLREWIGTQIVNQERRIITSKWTQGISVNKMYVNNQWLEELKQRCFRDLHQRKLTGRSRIYVYLCLLRHSFSDFEVHTNNLGILLKCIFEISMHILKNAYFQSRSLGSSNKVPSDVYGVGVWTTLCTARFQNIHFILALAI